MALVRWEPFQEVSNLQREMNRLFDSLSPLRYQELGNGAFTPAVEMDETDDAINVKLELPGMNPDDIDIQVGTDSLSISGERKTESKREDNGISRSEFHYGKFQRVIPLSSRIDNENVDAEYKDGILQLQLPKAPDARNKKVKVKAA